MRMNDSARRTTGGDTLFWMREPMLPPAIAPSTTSAAAFTSIEPRNAVTASATDAVSPIVKVLVAAATFTGRCITSLVIGVLMKPPPTPANPEGRRHSILNIDTNGFADNTDVFTVPDGNYFFMGDNRDNSQDSRFGQAVGGVGFVPAEYLIGRADRIMFSSAGRSMLYFWTWRPDRFFKAVE